MLPHGTLVLGGAASGKSEYAENLFHNSELNLIYLATGQIFDAEVAERVETHRARRDARWQTIEAPFDPGSPLADLSEEDGVLIDCATMWLSNLMMEDRDVAAAQKVLLEHLGACRARWVVVSNEVGHGIVPENALARRFREAQGRLNIALAAQANRVVQVIAGLPRVLKDETGKA